MTIGSIVISNNPVTAWESYEETLHHGTFRNLRVAYRDVGGYWSSSFEKKITDRERALAMFANGPGREVQIFTDDGRLNWEGFINSITLDTGTIKITMSLDDMSNRIWGRLQPVGGGAVSRSTVQNHTASQGRFGISEYVLTCGEMSLATANQLAQKYLAFHYWPAPSRFGWSSTQEVSLKYDCLGWWHTLKWRIYNQTVLAGETNASTVVAAIIAACGQFIATTNIETNLTQVARKTDVDRTASDLIESITEVGDGQTHPWVAGCSAGREFYYKQGARASL